MFQEPVETQCGIKLETLNGIELTVREMQLSYTCGVCVYDDYVSN